MDVDYNEQILDQSTVDEEDAEEAALRVSTTSMLSDLNMCRKH